MFLLEISEEHYTLTEETMFPEGDILLNDLAVVCHELTRFAFSLPVPPIANPQCSVLLPHQSSALDVHWQNIH